MDDDTEILAPRICHYHMRPVVAAVRRNPVRVTMNEIHTALAGSTNSNPHTADIIGEIGFANLRLDAIERRRQKGCPFPSDLSDYAADMNRVTLWLRQIGLYSAAAAA